LMIRVAYSHPHQNFRTQNLSVLKA